MSVKINVLRAFRFTVPANREKGQPLPVEKIFTVGEHEISADIAAHPWMAAPNLADGCIESETAAKARKKIADAKRRQANIDALNAKAQAQANFDRQQRSTQPAREAASKATEEELNTPIAVLRARQLASAKGRKGSRSASA
jgi:hypothetical protein